MGFDDRIGREGLNCELEVSVVAKVRYQIMHSWQQKMIRILVYLLIDWFRPGFMFQFISWQPQCSESKNEKRNKYLQLWKLFSILKKKQQGNYTIQVALRCANFVIYTTCNVTLAEP